MLVVFRHIIKYLNVGQIYFSQIAEHILKGYYILYYGFHYLLWKFANQAIIQMLEFHSAIHYHFIIYKYLLEQNYKVYPKVITFL